MIRNDEARPTEGSGRRLPVLIPGVVSVTFRQLTPAKIVRLAVEAGLRTIEWGGDVHVPPGRLDTAREVRQRTVDAGLQVAAYGSYYVAGRSEAGGSGFGRLLETAVMLGAPVIRVWAGRSGSVETPPETRAEIVRDLRRITLLAEAAGVDIALEFHHGTLTDTDESTLALFAEVGLKNLFTFWQPRHGEPTERALGSLRAMLPRLRNVHVFHWWPTAAQRLPLATGVERWREFLRVLRETGTPRHVLLEFVQDDDPENLRRDAATLRELSAAT